MGPRPSFPVACQFWSPLCSCRPCVPVVTPDRSARFLFQQTNLAQALIEIVIGAHRLGVFVRIVRPAAARQGRDHVVRPIV